MTAYAVTRTDKFNLTYRAVAFRPTQHITTSIPSVSLRSLSLTEATISLQSNMAAAFRILWHIFKRKIRHVNTSIILLGIICKSLEVSILDIAQKLFSAYHAKYPNILAN